MDLKIIMYYELLILLSLLLCVIIYQLIIGKINMKGLLYDKTTRKFSPGRVQLLTFTVVIAGYLILKITETGKFPDINQDLIVILGLSNFTYLGGKSRLLSFLTKK